MTAIGVDSKEDVARIHAKALELDGADKGASGSRAVGGDMDRYSVQIPGHF